jgi:Domain of unknown function (DUF4157)
MTYAPLSRAAKASAPASKSMLGATGLRVSEPDDAFEQEADRVAGAVMTGKRAGLDWSISRMSVAPVLRRKCDCGGSGGACEACRDDEEGAPASLQRKASGPSVSGEAPSPVQDVLSASGKPLDQASRKFFEPRFAHDFGKVRVHTGAHADRAARAVSAEAFTVGSDIAFRSGLYAPGTSAGRHLLAHELTHVVQQGRAGSALVQRSTGVGEPPKVASRMTPEDMLREILKTRGWTNRVDQPYLPENQRGPNMGHGVDTHAVLQVTDKDGRVVAHELGSHLTGDTSVERAARADLPRVPGEVGKVHAERMGLERLKVRLADVDVKGGTLEVVVDQLPCGPDKKDCLGEILKFAEEKGLKPKVYVPQDEAGPSPKGAAMRAFRDPPLAGGEPSPTGGAALRQIWPPGETYAPAVESGGLSPINPLPEQAKTGGLTEALDEEVGRKAGALGSQAEAEALEAEALETTAMRGGTLGEFVLSESMGLAIGLVTLVAQVVWTLVIEPKINAFLAPILERRRADLKKQIQDRFNLYQARYIERVIKSCYLKQLQAMEAAGKTGYVNVTMRVSFMDTSNRVQLFKETPPESMFDIEVNDVDRVRVQVGDAPVKASVGPLSRCDDCGTFGRSKTFVANNPLWSQEVTFSFRAPRSEVVVKELEKEGAKEPTTGDCVAASACFIATACYGSPLAAEVELLRRFRNSVLLPTRGGRLAATAYYRLSPPMAFWLTKHPYARAATRRLLVAPLVLLVRLTWRGGRTK